MTPPPKILSSGRKLHLINVYINTTTGKVTVEWSSDFFLYCVSFSVVLLDCNSSVEYSFRIFSVSIRFLCAASSEIKMLFASS